MDALAKKVMSKHGLSLEAARKHRAKQMPQRVVDPTSRLGFRRAEQGETESCEPYPLALGSLADVFLSLDSFGLGVSLYFRQLAWIFCVVFVCAMILCPSTTHNASACRHGDDVTTKPAYANTGLARGTASGCVVWDLSVGLNVAPDVVVVVVILLAALTSTFLQSTFSKRIEGNLQTPSDYSVVVANPPAHVLDPDRRGAGVPPAIRPRPPRRDLPQVPRLLREDLRRRRRLRDREQGQRPRAPAPRAAQGLPPGPR